MSKKLVNIGNNIRLVEDVPSFSLENKNYLIRFDPNIGYYLTDYESFTFPDKLYGAPKLEEITDRVLNTFRQTKRAVGILLSGLKGTGKSIQMKHIAANSDMPVIIIDQLYPASDILQLLNGLKRECVIVIDEFEKIYKGENQEAILPLLDGISSQPHIFVLTSNTSVNQYLNGRPSRIRYSIKYSKVEQSIIEEIIDENLENIDVKDSLLSTLSMIADVNIDTVLTLIGELNLYKDIPYKDTIKIFNLEDPSEGRFDFFIECEVLAGNSEMLDKAYKYLSDKKLPHPDYSQQIIGNDIGLNELQQDLKNEGIVLGKYSHVYQIAGIQTISQINEYIRYNENASLRSNFNSDVPFKEDVLNNLDYIRFMGSPANLVCENDQLKLKGDDFTIIAKPKSTPSYSVF